MPPKKRTRMSTAASPAPPPSSTKDTPADPPQDDNDNDDEATAAAEAAAAAQAQADFDASNVADPWTDEEEIGLFKGLIKWKPTGIHKNFKMLSLQQYLLSNGYIHPEAQHTRVPGIWEKLRSLYDLDALDQREDAHALPWSAAADEDDVDELGDDGDGDDDEVEEDFELPEEEFAARMWKQRFATGEEEDREESPPVADELVARADSPPVRFTPSFDITESEDKATPSRRGKAAATPASRAKTKAPRTSMAAVATRRSSRVADSVDPDEEDEEEEEEAEESGEDSKAGSTASGTPAPKGRSRPPTRSKPVKARAKRRR